jgi:CheY-like chemotaxis protein
MNEVAVLESGALTPIVVPTAQLVLHIDDDPNDTELLRAAVTKANLDLALHSVEDGEQAVAFLENLVEDSVPPPKLILLDLKMPRVTGFDLLRWIRSHIHLCNTPVVVLSGSSCEIDVDGALAAGANSYVEKPFEFDGLVRMIRNLNDTWLHGRKQAHY